MSRSSGLGLLAAALLAIAIAGCGGGNDSTSTATVTAGSQGGSANAGGAANTGGKSAAPRAETVDMVDFSFDQAKVTIQAGGKVTWKNMGQAPHTATADDGSFDTGTVDLGKLKAETEAFKQPGTISYHCSIHPQMHGTIEVVPG